MTANPSAPEGLALEGASAVLRGLPVDSTTSCAAALLEADHELGGVCTPIDGNHEGARKGRPDLL